MDIHRLYVPADREACLRLLDSNTPEYFHPSERAAFEVFLDEMNWPYQVIERHGLVVACGGHALEPDGRTVSLCWGMVLRRLQGEGLGSRLTEARLAAARATPGAAEVRLDTGARTAGFYQRFGFVIDEVIPDGYAPGNDRYEMRLGLRTP